MVTKAAVVFGAQNVHDSNLFRFHSEHSRQLADAAQTNSMTSSTPRQFEKQTAGAPLHS